MKKKITVSTAVTLIILTVALTVSITMLVAIRYFNRQVQDVSQRQAMYTHINDVDKKVREYYTDLDEEALRRGITEGYIKGLGDRYAAYFSTEGYVQEKNRLAGRCGDVGLGVCVNAAGQLVVWRVDADSAADKGGVKVGDVLKALDNEEVAGKTEAEIQAKLDAAAKVLLSVEREGSPLAFELSAYEHTLRSVQSEKLGSVGYVRVTAFYENTPEQFKSTVSSLVEQGVTGLVFDLRDNAGGLRSAAEEVIAYLMPLGQYGTETDKNGTATSLVSKSNNQLSLPTATLINSGTAGEAEFFAGVLQEFSFTTVVGETSAGKAKYQEYFTLEADNSAIKLTVGEYSRLKNGSWQDQGITPDLESALTDSQKANIRLTAVADDPQVKTALSQIGNPVTPKTGSANKANSAAANGG